VLLLTAGHVLVDALLAGVLITACFFAPVVSVLLVLPCAYLAAFAAALVDATIITAVRDSVAEGKISLANALAVAWSHRKPLAVWAFDLLVVGLAIRLGAALFGRVGQLLGWGAEIAWTIVALLVVPTIVVGDVPMPAAFDASRRSLRGTFGDRVRGVGGLNLIGLLVVAPVVGLVVLAALTDSGALIAISLIGLAFVGLAYAFVLDASTAVLGYAIYAHAEDRPLPPGFTQAALHTSVTANPIVTP
jgi:hypothetical protein